MPPRLLRTALLVSGLVLLAGCGTRGNLTLPRTPPPAPLLGGTGTPQIWWNGALPASATAQENAPASGPANNPNTAKEATPQ